jgi:thioredoxin-related protein
MKIKYTLYIAAIIVLVACKSKQNTGNTEMVEVEAPPPPQPPVPPPPPAPPVHGNINAGTLTWVSLEEAIEMQSLVPKPIMVDVYTHWCGPCKMLAKNTFGDGRVAAYLSENYYCVKFDAESPDSLTYAGITYKNPEYVPNQPGRNGVHQFTRYLNVTGYPTLFFFDKAAQPIGPVVGYKTPAQIEIFLHFFAEEKYTTVRTQEEWTEYEKNFTTTWN